MSDNSEWQSESQQEPSSQEKSRRRTAGSSTRTMADLLFLPETERSLMNWLVRQQRATVSEIAAHFGQDESAVQTLLDELVAQGYVQTVEQADRCDYQPNLVSRKGRNVPTNIWDALK